ncbi:MAG: hypothetical protein ABUJ98_10635 [Hyphomicrobium sp.]
MIKNVSQVLNLEQKYHTAFYRARYWGRWWVGEAHRLAGILMPLVSTELLALKNAFLADRPKAIAILAVSGTPGGSKFGYYQPHAAELGHAIGAAGNILIKIDGFLEHLAMLGGLPISELSLPKALELLAGATLYAGRAAHGSGARRGRPYYIYYHGDYYKIQLAIRMSLIPPITWEIAAPEFWNKELDGAVSRRYDAIHPTIRHAF